MLGQFYIYRHIRPDTGQVFYVGKGKNRRNAYTYERAYAKNRRNSFWNNVVKKNNGEYIIEVMMEFDTSEECIAKEIELIKLYGRADVGLGTLVNLTDGGDGKRGKLNEIELMKRREMWKGKIHPNTGRKLSAEARRKRSEKTRGADHHLFGTKLPEQWRNNIAKTKVGKLNPNYGKSGYLSPVSKMVMNRETGVVYGSISQAAKAEGVNVKTLYQYLDGTKKNKTNLVRI